jgi:hypothetical protein
VPLFDSHIVPAGSIAAVSFQYDVTADGKRFLVATSGAGAASSAANRGGELAGETEEMTSGTKLDPCEIRPPWLLGSRHLGNCRPE